MFSPHRSLYFWVLAAAIYAPLIKSMEEICLTSEEAERLNITYVFKESLEDSKEEIEELISSSIRSLASDNALQKTHAYLDQAATRAQSKKECAPILRIIKLLQKTLKSREELQIALDSALHAAASENQKDMVLFLLEEGANILAKDDQGRSAIYTPALQGFVEMTALLIEKGAPCDNTILYNVAMRAEQMPSSNLTNIKMMQEGIPYNNVRENYIKIVEYLIDTKESDTTIKDEFGWTLLHWAARFGSLKATENALLQSIEIDALYKGHTPLELAMLNGHEKVAKLLYTSGARFKSDTFISAASRGHASIIAEFVKHADKKTLTSALENASAQGHTLIAQRLLAHGASLNESRALYSACVNGHLEIVKLLFEKGAQGNLWDNTGENLLFKAVEYGHNTIVTYLLTKVDPRSIKTENGWTLLHQAATSNNPIIVELLLKLNLDKEACYFSRTPLHTAVVNGSKAAVEIFLKHKSSVTTRDEYGNTPLLSAVDKEFEGITYTLLKNGAPPNDKNKKAETPFSLAVKAGNLRMVELLIEYGAQIERNKDLIEDVTRKLAEVNQQSMNDYGYDACWTFGRRKFLNSILSILKNQDSK